MLTYTPFDAPEPGESSIHVLQGNPFEGTIGPVNVGEAERYGSILAGVALIATGVSRRSLGGLLLAALGGAFIVRGVGGHCRLYDSLGVATSGAPGEGTAQAGS